MPEIKGLVCPLMSTKSEIKYCRTDCVLYPGNGKKCVSGTSLSPVKSSKPDSTKRFV